MPQDPSRAMNFIRHYPHILGYSLEQEIKKSDTLNSASLEKKLTHKMLQLCDQMLLNLEFPWFEGYRNKTAYTMFPTVDRSHIVKPGYVFLRVYMPEKRESYTFGKKDEELHMMPAYGVCSSMYGPMKLCNDKKLVDCYQGTEVLLLNENDFAEIMPVAYNFSHIPTTNNTFIFKHNNLHHYYRHNNIVPFFILITKKGDYKQLQCNPSESENYGKIQSFLTDKKSKNKHKKKK